jgi:hypothetical protein
MRKTISANIAWGSAILRRLDAATGLGAVVEKWRDTFRAAHDALVAREDAVVEAFDARHAHGASVGEVAADLDGAFERLLAQLPAAGLADRRRPLGDLSPLTPSEIAHLGNVHRAEAVAVVVTNVRAKIAKGVGAKNKDLVAAVDALSSAATALLGSVTASGAPADAYHQAVHRRDEELQTWQTTLSRLRRRVETHFEDTPARAAEIFAAPDGAEAEAAATAVSRKSKADKRAEEKAERAAAKAAAKAARAAVKAEKQAAKIAKAAAKKLKGKKR